ncbi:hypothetical protein PG994_012714 [Apiospora phragmitis]|uniref:Glyoxalase-like domain-containing protein n=1 Tax=Apiospora phragmitis TaxID=2905665 RepID=A0ABR1TB82_9PEZI
MSPEPSTTPPLLDHIVILVPHAFLASPPSWLAKAFMLHPGGKHADGVTENVLVFFADGSYLELIAFVDDDVGRGGRAGHRWGRQREGTVIDWALTLLLSSTSSAPSATTTASIHKGAENDDDRLGSVPAAFQEIQQKVRDAGDGAIAYRDLVRGGRNRPDGEVLKWAISAADDAATGKPLEPGVLPFWCLRRDASAAAGPLPGREAGGARFWRAAAAALQPDAVATTSGSRLKPVYDVLFAKKEGGGDSGHEGHRRWTVGTPEDGHHERGEVHLRTTGGHDAETYHQAEEEGTEKLTIKFFTTSWEFAGKTIGGRITDEVRLEFEFVSSSN